MTILFKRIVILIKYLLAVLIILLAQLPQGNATELYPQNLKIKASLSDYNYKSNAEIEKLFRENLSSFDNIVYTIIPMGVVVSINGYMFYDEGKDKLKENAFGILDIMARLIKNLDKPCLIESNTTATSFENSDYMSNWELSIVRANDIVSYLISKEIPPKKIRANGFGEMIPFYNENNNPMQERIDFVIFNYEDNFRQ